MSKEMQEFPQWDGSFNSDDFYIGPHEWRKRNCLNKQRVQKAIVKLSKQYMRPDVDSALDELLTSLGMEFLPILLGEDEEGS